MQIGINCFSDYQIRSMIESHNKVGTCEITGDTNCYIYDTESEDDYLKEYFEEILDVFTPKDKLVGKCEDDKVDFIKTYLSRWGIFNVNENMIEKILMKICRTRYINDRDLFEQKIGIRESFDINYLEKNSLLKNHTWKDFCYYVKHINRYHVKYFNFGLFEKLLENMELSYEAGGIILYRARISDQNGFKATDMGSPPINRITTGRTNAAGIHCLYLSSDAETTFHEKRVRKLDYVAVGEFELRKNITIVDLSLFDRIGPLSIGDFDLTWFALNIDIIRNIGNEIANPLSRFDSNLDYVPTQFICDYIKFLGYDGIKYKSTLNTTGVNYAIFNENLFRCKDVQVYHIENCQYEMVSIPH